ncbi:MAG: putative LPS assembly protein LptD [Bacteroidota bacterium]
MRLVSVLVCLLCTYVGFCQAVDSLAQDSTKAVSIEKLLPNDSIASDSLTAPAANAPKNTINRSDVETTINYDARDSMYFNVKTQELYLYGETHIDYGETTLEAERTDVNWTRRTIHAKFETDSTGKKIGKPVYSDGVDVYATEDIIYNFKTSRAVIKGVVTQQDDAFMHGEDVKKSKDGELFIRGAGYTTCNLAEPHFEIRSSMLKVIPGNKVVSGPFNMRFRDLPTPLFFPFGMFPQPKRKASGIIFPSYGEERRRGFFLRDAGYYFAINDYIDARITGDIYSKGGNSLNATTNYFKRYSFRGSMNFSYTRTVTDELEGGIEQNDYRIRWNHSPLSRRNSSFSASVNAATQSFNQNNNLVVQDFSQAINSQLSSNISYRNSLQGTPFNMSLNLRHNQNLSTEIVNLTLPDFTLNLNRIYPLKRFSKSSNSPLAKLNFSHNFVSRHEVSNATINDGAFRSFTIANENPLADSVLSFNADNLSLIMDRSRFGGKHNVPISTSMTVLKYFTLSPSFNFEELWYTKELDYTFIPEENAVRIDTIQGFSRAGSWSTGASLNTRLYGFVPFKSGKIRAIRHVMTPSVSFSYSPDFSDTRYGVFEEVQTDITGTTQILSRYEGFVYGSPRGGESKTIGFSLSNNIEMKVASKKDTVNGTKKIKLFDNLGISSGYNLAADSFRLSNINFNARTSFFESKLTVNFTGTLDPYEYLLISESFNSNGERRVVDRRLDRYTWNNGNGLGRLSNMNVSLGMNLAPKGTKNKNSRGASYGESDALQQGTGLAPPDENVDFEGYTEEERQELNNIQNNPDEYIDFDVPWSLRMQYSVNRTQSGLSDATIRQSFQFSGSLGLTNKTQITFNSGYDFEAKDFTTTRIGVSRDLHCWTMNFDWVPFGNFQSYFFSIRVKSAVLQDLKYEKRRSFFDFFN